MLLTGNQHASHLCQHFGTVWESWAILQRPEDYDNFSEVRQNMVDKELESGMLRK